MQRSASARRRSTSSLTTRIRVRCKPPPEEADALEQAAQFREALLHIPGVRNDVEFWINEWNVSPTWDNSNESVQARYVPRFFLYTHAQGMRPFMWTFVPSIDGNEGDQFRIIHGDTGGADAFRPREALRGFEATSALFGQTTPDPMAEFRVAAPAAYSHGELKRYAFRDSQSGKRIYAFWLAVYADPADRFQPVSAELAVGDPGVKDPVLIDVRTGAVSALEWVDRAKRTLRVPLKDIVMAVVDASYLDWPELPAAPGELRAVEDGAGVRLEWNNHNDPRLELQRSTDYGPWQPAAELAAGTRTYVDVRPAAGHVTYRIRAKSDTGPSAWSNPAWVR